MSVRTIRLLIASALVALAIWPLFTLGDQHRHAAAALPTAAPLLPDYRDREDLVAFYERAARRDSSDQISAQLLAGQYLQRFRERGDVGDLMRAERWARHALQLQQFNPGGEVALASALVGMHRFREALVHAHRALLLQPWDDGARAQEASIDMELGRYKQAGRLLRAPVGHFENPNWDSTAARYGELLGKLVRARRLMDRAMAYFDSVSDNPAEARAWYHFRAGELAFAAGDLAAAETRLHEALNIFPQYPRAYTALARLYCAQHSWREALEAAERGAELLPLPETLGYKADAQRALGDFDGARQTDDLIRAIERIGNARGINDRLIATYYAEHHLYPADAIRIARRDLAARDDIYSEDTLAWALAAAGRWEQARAHARRAVEFDTEDARLQFHAAVIALHFGDRGQARARLQKALALNPQFHQVYADQAKRLLAQLEIPR